MRHLAIIGIFLFTGLAVLAGPSRINDLLVMQQTNSGVVLRWTAAIPAASTTLTNLQVRYSTTPINTLNWSNATLVEGLVDPGTPGTLRSAIVTSLTPGTLYYFAIKTQDSDGEWSIISKETPPAAAGAAATSVILAWDPSPDASVAGYRVYYGIESGNYIDSVDVGNVTTATMGSLVWGVTYYYAAAAYDASGVQSPLSNETSYTP